MYTWRSSIIRPHLCILLYQMNGNVESLKGYRRLHVNVSVASMVSATNSGA